MTPSQQVQVVNLGAVEDVRVVNFGAGEHVRVLYEKHTLINHTQDYTHKPTETEGMSTGETEVIGAVAIKASLQPEKEKGFTAQFPEQDAVGPGSSFGQFGFKSSLTQISGRIFRWARTKFKYRSGQA